MMGNGPESFAPDEAGSASEGVSEQAREQRAAGSQQAAQQLIQEEKRSKKRDDRVAQIILQFLTDEQKTHLAVLIARLVALDCPTPFLLALLSLINEKCRIAVEEYVRELDAEIPSLEGFDRSLLTGNASLTDEANELLASWIVRCSQIMQVDHERILDALILDDRNIDGTILQLTTFVLQDFLASYDRTPPFEQLQALTIGILQSLFSPAMTERRARQSEEEEA